MSLRSLFVPFTTMNAIARSGNERSWWTGYGVDPMQVAAELWRESQATNRLPAEPLEVAAVPVIQTAGGELGLSMPAADQPRGAAQSETEAAQ